MSGADLDPMRPRIFGIGLNKTGTSSFHEALTLLGYRSLHWGGPTVRRAVEGARDAGRPLLADIDPTFDAFSDILPLAQGFALLDEQYPGSHFVLTVRPTDQWIDSRRRHVENNVRRKAAGEYDGDFLVVDQEGWRAEWTHHVSSVRRYFGARTDFLEVDLTSGGGWAPLCRLLDVPRPGAPFPWVNSGRTARDEVHDDALRSSS